jgi:hypothetical protein
MKNHRRPSVPWILVIAVFLLPGLACSFTPSLDDAGNHVADPGFSSITKVEPFWGNGTSTSSLTYGLYVTDMKTIACQSVTKVTLQILPDQNFPESSGIPAGAYSPDEYLFTAEILDPIPSFQPSAANKNIEECVDSSISDSVSVKINGIYNTRTRQLTPMYISHYPCTPKDVTIGFTTPSSPNGSENPLQGISGSVTCKSEQQTYSTSFMLSQLQP